MLFYVGVFDLHQARHFERAFISVNRLRLRRSPFAVRQWIIDSGAFTEISTHGGYRHPVRAYADEVRRWRDLGELAAVVSQDLMCEPFILKRTGRTVASHQAETIARYEELLGENLGVPVMPALQGISPREYLDHLDAYGDRLAPGTWVGVGSVCKRNTDPDAIVEVLDAIKRQRPDLRLHGFGVKKTALKHPGVRALLASADSMAWSFHARKNGRKSSDWQEAESFRRDVDGIAARPPRPWQTSLPLF